MNFCSQQAYQGIVPLDGDDVATVIENYMQRSEQLDTKLWLAANGQVSRGLLLQKLPTTGGINTPEDELDTWNRMSMLGNTLRTEELLSTDIETLLRRLFWEETIRVFDPDHPQFHCLRRTAIGGLQLEALELEEGEWCSSSNRVKLSPSSSGVDR